MQKATLALLALAAPSAASPVGKVISMLSDLEAKILKEGETVQKEYAEVTEWCEERSRNLGFEIKTGQANVESLKAAIAEETATTSSLTTKVEELVASISSNDADLQAATQIRKAEAADFSAEEKELMETVDMLNRATTILEREMNGGASMMQMKNAGNFAQVFSTMLQASLIDSRDASKLTALVQQAHRDSDDDEAPGAPAGEVYKSQSGGIVDTLQDLTEKAESQLAETRQKEVSSRNNYEMLKQSLEDEIKVAKKDKDEAQKGIAESGEKKSTADGDLTTTAKELSADVKTKGDLHQTCVEKASTFEAETQSRGEELKALATAKKIIKEATGAALDQVSFVQVSRSALASSTDLHHYEAVRLIRDLARKENSGALMQLASRMAGAMHSGDAFEKIKGLISDMIAKLEKEAGADATKKAYCDKELAETNAKKADKSDEIEGLTTKTEQLAAKSAQLKEEVSALENGLSKLAKSQAEMDKLRQEEKDAFAENKAVLEKGLTGVKQALKVLRDYYASDSSHDSAQGAGNGIIELLEVVEADFSKNLAQITSDEDQSAAAYEATTKENDLDRTLKEQDVKYKTKESKSLDKTATELTGDRTGVQAELDAVLEYLTQLEGECIAKAETYAARTERREAEIAGLKEALQILESETALVQRRSRRTLRGATLKA